MASEKTTHTYWQIGCGSDQRDYSQEFLRYGMAFVGGETQCATMPLVHVGDRVAMKLGMSLVAVGTVVERNGECHGNAAEINNGEKEWLRDFDGWDLQAYCYVNWRKLEKKVTMKGFTRATITRINSQKIIGQLDRIFEESSPITRYFPEPSPTQKVTLDDILNFLIAEGLSANSAGNLTDIFKKISLMAYYYRNKCDWNDVREQETRTFLIIPLLLALGWSEQQIKIELPTGNHGRIDIACFNKPFAMEGSECQLIIETKGFRQGLYYAPEQVHGYAQSFPKCWVTVVTNGYCYKVFRRNKNGFCKEPSSYFNILNPRDRYPLNTTIDGCLEALRCMLPGSFR